MDTRRLRLAHVVWGPSVFIQPRVPEITSERKENCENQYHKFPPGKVYTGILRLEIPGDIYRGLLDFIAAYAAQFECHVMIFAFTSLDVTDKLQVAEFYVKKPSKLARFVSLEKNWINREHQRTLSF